MLVSRNWLKDYVDLDMPIKELEERLAMSGLNHEGTESHGDDLAIDLEVTSNRPDCLGHLGVAREIAVLWQQPLRLPEVELSESAETAEQHVAVKIDCPDLCSRYTARIIRGVKIGPSPDWLVDRLAAAGINSVNNVVDVTNYVMLECGQPLHAFDLACVRGNQIIVREASTGEKFVAIDHKEYELGPGMCVIADAEQASALGGVMGGAESEVSDTTVDLLIEAAEFHPLSIRSTARALNLHSPSSYRFERRIDSESIDWASRRCCQLIVQLAGGDVCQGVVDVGAPIPARDPVTLRLAAVPRVLGIDVAADEVERILSDLGCEVTDRTDTAITVTCPSWRGDLEREIDLVEEVARVHGYDQIPEDVGVPMAASHRTDHDRVMDVVRHTLTALGFDEALTPSVVPSERAAAFDGWVQAEPLRTQTPMLRGADCLRQSILPSLLECLRVNQSLGNSDVELFESAHIYLPADQPLPREQWTVSLCSQREFGWVKGAIESLLDGLHCQVDLSIEDVELDLLQSPRAARMLLGDKLLGFIGEVDAAAVDKIGIRGQVSVAEFDVHVLQEFANLVPQYQELSPYPAVQRDLNLVVAESVRWADLEKVVAEAAGDHLESVSFLEDYRDPDRDGEDRKRMLFSMTFRSAERTLTGQEVDDVRDQVVAACSQQLDAVLLA